MSRDFERIILTPEHVEIRLVPAGVGPRFLALLADSTVAFGLSFSLGRLIAPALPGGIASSVTATLSFVIVWGYHVYFETRHQGRSPGKRMAGLRVVDGRGLPIRLRQSFIRNIVRALDFAPFFYGFGALACLLDRHRRRLGDIVADTLVIAERPSAEYAGQLPSSLRFNSLRTPRILRLIRHRIGLEEREFLLTLCLRAETLAPGARFDMMEEVAGFYKERLGIDDPHLSGENLVRDLTSILHSRRVA